jgi:hypothetical protein
LKRRTFLGTLGAVGVAAAIPLNWKKQPAAPVDISEYVDTADISIESSTDGENWGELLENSEFEDWKTGEGGTITGYWNPTRPTLTVDGEKVELESYDISFATDAIPCDTVFDSARTFIQGLKQGAEIRCTTYHAEFLAELMYLRNHTRKIEIDTKDGVRFSCVAFPTSVEHHYSPYSSEIDPGFLSNVTFKVVGEIIRHA